MYHVVFEGEIADGVSLEEAKRNLVSMFKMKQDFVERHFFSHSPSVVKENLDKHTAEKYRRALRKAGLICRIEKMSSVSDPFPKVSLASIPLATESSSNVSRAQNAQGTKEVITCPKCSFEQGAADICVSCGIVIDKYFEKKQAPLTPPVDISPQYNTVPTKKSSGLFAKVLVLAVALLGGFYYFQQNQKPPLSPEIARMAEADPRQQKIFNQVPFSFKDCNITRLASFSLVGRVLSRKDYSTGKESKLSPLDLAMGWGPMSKPEVVDKISVSQGNRWLEWKAGPMPIPPRTIELHSANMHIIPADQVVEKEVARVERGNYISLKGSLVRVKSSEGWQWVSSLTREDTGDGACEVIWVEEINILH